MNIYIGEPIIISDMQGPAPDGFHVPLNTEWQAIYDAFTGLGLSGGTNFSTYLKLPMAGYREHGTLSFYNRGSSGRYWSSTPYDKYYSFYLDFNTSSVSPQASYVLSYGLSVRCLKNSPTIPTSSWTKLYGTSIESGGIFHNTTDGLISISSNGSTWYTLMDKNLGATTVYNYGDTLTDANCGNVFQRGNNYAFPGADSSETITSSGRLVNVTGYGPGNYYESSTWITSNPRQINPGNNLRGGVSQGTSTKSVEVKNIYIGEVKSYLPGIYHNSSLGLISLSSDGETWTTIADKNLGATVAWNDGDTLSESNCGKYYQRGNNYGFPFTGSVGVSNTRVNASSYGPGNYYSGSIFRNYDYSPYDWSNPSNNNLWGATTGTVEAMQGPCDNGFHIPTKNEFESLFNLGVSMGAWASSSGGANMMTYLKMPKNGDRYYYNGNIEYQGSNGHLWCSDTGDGSGYVGGNYLYVSVNPYFSVFFKEYGYGIRPFKNEPVVPDSTWTTLYQLS